MKNTLIVLMLCFIPTFALAVESQERLNSFDQIERKGVNASYYAGVEQAGEKVTIKVTDKWTKLTGEKKKAFVNQATSLFFGMGGARGFKEAKAMFVVSFINKKSGDTVATWTGMTGAEIYK